MLMVAWQRAFVKVASALLKVTAVADSLSGGHRCSGLNGFSGTFMWSSGQYVVVMTLVFILPHWLILLYKKKLSGFAIYTI